MKPGIVYKSAEASFLHLSKFTLFYSAFYAVKMYCIKFAAKRYKHRFMKPQFTKLVKAGDRLREFNFRRLPSDRVLSVDVSDERGSRHMFKMQKSDEEQWKIDAPNLPGWIYEAENQLGQAIEQD
jgi:hypothetical protein